MTYNGAGYVATLTDSGGRTVTYTHDGAGRVTSETGPVGTITYQYDASNRMTQIGYPNGGVHNYGFDSQGRVIHEDDGSGQNAVDYAFYKSSTTMTDALGHVTVYEFTNKQGYKKNTRVVDAQGNATLYAYDANYAVSVQTDALGRQTKYINDARGNPLQVTDPAGGRTATNYHPLYSLPTLLVDPLNRSTVMSYDDSGDLIRVQDPMGGITRKSYDAQGHVTQDQDPLNHATQYSYKASNGSLASIVDPLSQTTLLETDPLSRVTKNTDPTNKATQYQYDAAGNVTQVTDAMGHSTQYSYAPGRTEKLLSQVTDANGHTTTFGYDAQGRQTSVTNALNQTKSSVYDAKGNLVQTTNARGQTITYTYDSLDRLTRKTLPEGQINYSYDAVGNVTQITHYNGSSIQNTYDSLNRLTQQIQTLPNGYAATIGYAYDAAGNRTQMTTPWGNFSYAYDANNRLTKIVNPQSKVFTFAYDAAGRRTRLNYPNGVRTDYTYDNANRVLSIIAKRTSDNVIVSSVAYTYDAAGNRTSMTDWEGTHSYGYDDLHRLTSATHPATSVLPIKNETFTYDAVGNRLADAAIGGYTYDSANRLTQNSSFTYTYDEDGNRTTSADQAEGPVELKFNSENELVGAKSADGSNWSYRYDAKGRRVEKSSGSAVGQGTYFIYDGQDIISVLDAQNQLLWMFTYGQIIDEPLSFRSQVGYEYYFHQDALENIKALSESSGNGAERSAYLAFGGAVILGPSGVPVPHSVLENRFGLEGREWDPETGTYYYRARQYDPKEGRFLQSDPVGLNGGINEYLFVEGNPTNLIDPSGLTTFACKRKIVYTPEIFHRGAFFHEYLCVIIDGVTTCRGWAPFIKSMQKELPPGSKGVACEALPSTSCFDRCILESFNSPPPSFDLGNNSCQATSNNAVLQCSNLCSPENQ